MSSMSVFAWALFGGAFFELLHWGGIKRSKHFPVYFGSAKYWLVTVLMIVFGALLAIAVSLSGTALTPLTAILLGYSAPSIIQKLAANAPPPVLGNAPDGPPSPSVYSFLVG